MTFRRLLPLLILTTPLTLLAQRGGSGYRAPSAVALSPDGTTMAWTVGGREGTTLHLDSATAPDPAKEKIIAPNGTTNCSNTSPVWAPDSQTLAYTSTCTSPAAKKEEKPGASADNQAQIFLYNKTTGESRQLTHVTGLFKQAAFSPDGKALAFLFVENATRSAGALDAMKPFAGVIGEDGVEIQRVYGVLTADGKGNWMTPENLHVYEFAWSPVAPEITYVAAAPPGENTWWIAKLYTRMHGAEPRVVFDPATTTSAMHGLQIAVPRFSPDGKKIAFIGGLMSDQGSTGGDIWVVNADGKSAPTDITPNIDGTPTWEGWYSNNLLGFVEDRRGHTLFVVWDAAKQAALHPGTDLGQVSVSGGPIKNAVSFSTQTGVTAYVQSGMGKAPEVWLSKASKPEQWSHLNDNAPARPQPRTESIEWQNEGFTVQGWLTYPVDYDAKKKYPMIVAVHGGPSASAGAQGGAQWAALGYFSFSPNPRGSFGQGEKFTAANRKDFGYGDLRDILAGIDFLEKTLPIDDHRLGLTGWSYGGFMSMFAETQTNRFRAIVAGAGISNWQSYYGENSIAEWMVPFFGDTVYNDPAVYAKSSAITYIKNAKTPMLIIVGDRDGECPAPQSFEMWSALKAQHVKTQLVVYPNEGHGFRDPAHIADRAARTQKWFAENFKD